MSWAAHFIGEAEDSGVEAEIVLMFKSLFDELTGKQGATGLSCTVGTDSHGTGVIDQVAPAAAATVAAAAPTGGDDTAASTGDATADPTTTDPSGSSTETSPPDDGNGGGSADPTSST